MNTSLLAGRSLPGINDQFVPVTPALLQQLHDDELRVGDILTCAEDGRVTGFWREM
ncbi:hypothetical protein VSR69_42605 [Paraburkholderia phytofirmans]|uniref:hypothetical protein n=1 Tax=Paraburkholderia sp. BL9I2N2 TaxID=1938809 RepID=UPI0010E258AC|nr:hypothetical protein [Paraburkholderia sp. BL9I2N2]TCK94123.1 hypothetical protein B0G74_0659 [Paraburkholderia sp. BL9I2N2]